MRFSLKSSILLWLLLCTNASFAGMEDESITRNLRYDGYFSSPEMHRHFDANIPALINLFKTEAFESSNPVSAFPKAKIAYWDIVYYNERWIAEDCQPFVLSLAKSVIYKLPEVVDSKTSSSARDFIYNIRIDLSDDFLQYQDEHRDRDSIVSALIKDLKLHSDGGRSGWVHYLYFMMLEVQNVSPHTLVVASAPLVAAKPSAGTGDFPSESSAEIIHSMKSSAGVGYLIDESFVKNGRHIVHGIEGLVEGKIRQKPTRKKIRI